MTLSGTKIYGIKNCDTVKKARKWLESNQLDIPFHDFREDGLDEALLSAWVDTLGWEAVFNKRSTSYRALSDTDKADIDAPKAILLMLAQPTLIKRPVLVDAGRVQTGFSDTTYSAWFKL